MKKLTFTIALFIAAMATYAGTEEIFVYPNPSQDQIYVEIPANMEGITTLTVFDLSGREVFNVERSVDEYEFRKTLMSVADLSDGTYILRVSDNEHVSTTKFSKQE